MALELELHNPPAPLLLNRSDMNAIRKTTQKEATLCARRRRSLVRKVSFRIAATLGFFTTLFSMTFLCNGSGPTSALSTLRRVGEVIRLPAMMRVNPLVHRPGAGSALEKIALKEEMLDLSVDDNDFALVTRSGDFKKGADGRGVQAVREMARDYSMIIPATLSPVSDVGGVSMQIVDHSINAFFNQASIKNSFVGRAAETVEKKLKAEVVLGGAEPDSLKHNIKFQLKASETKASMEYRGLTNCDLSYSVASRKANFEIYEPISKSSNLVFTHSDAPSDRRDILSLRMHW